MAETTDTVTDTITDTLTAADFPSEPESSSATESTCRECGELRHFTEYRPLPPNRGGPDKRSKVCVHCVGAKVSRTLLANAEEKRLANGTDDDPRLQQGANRDWIIKELTRQYIASDKQADKIRCLETLAKLHPNEQKTKLDDPAVVRSLLAAMKAKKKPTDGE